MKLPRDLSGRDLARALKVLGYEITRETGSHLDGARRAREAAFRRRLIPPPLKVHIGAESTLERLYHGADVGFETDSAGTTIARATPGGWARTISWRSVESVAHVPPHLTRGTNRRNN